MKEPKLFIQIELNRLKAKYAKRPCGKKMAYPPGGADVNTLIKIIEELIKEV